MKSPNRGCLAFCLLFVFFIAPGVAQSVSPEPRAESGAGQLELRGESGAWTRALHLDSEVHFRISGMLAHVSFRQSFRNTGQEWSEGRYVFPLPEGAAVNRMRMRVGEREIIGKIRERGEARKQFEKAKQQGRRVSLVEQHRPNLFSNRVANIAPGELVTVELNYVQTLDFRDGLFSLRFPTTLTARYIPGQPLEESAALQASAGEGWAFNTAQVPDASSITPPQFPPGSRTENRIRISAELDMGMPLALVESPYHEISLEMEGDVHRLNLARDTALMDRDFLLRWRPVSGSEPQAALFRERIEGREYALLMLLPPVADTPSALPREMVFVIDTSGSMGGEPIRQAKASLQYALGQLRPGDRFNVIEFDSSARALFRASMPADSHHLARASELVRHLSAGGGTEMRQALRLALQGQEESHLLRQVIFITDGAVGNELELFQQIEQTLGGSRLFTVGIGSAPNSWFMREAARFGRGSFTYVTDPTDTEPRMRELFEMLSHPLATDLVVNWGAEVEMWPPRLPELYRGEPLLIAARVEEGESLSQVVVSGRLQGSDWQRQLSSVGQGGHNGVSVAWARRKIRSLLDERVHGVPEEQVRARVLPIALQHQLMSPYTSFIAIEKKPARPVGDALHKEAVPNQAPSGQSPQPYAWPKTAAGTAAHLVSGFLLLLCAAVLFAMGRIFPDSGVRV